MSRYILALLTLSMIPISDIYFEIPHSILAAHCRIGAGPHARGSKAFSPHTNIPDDKSFARYWMIIVRCVQHDFLEVIAIPGDCQAKFYLRTGLALPGNYAVKSIEFYGDNGNSSLSPNLDIDAATNEGRQSLGLIVERKECSVDESGNEVHDELWLFKYDEISFDRIDFETNTSKEIRIAAADFSQDNCIALQAENDGVLVTKRRHICTRQSFPTNEQTTKLNLCGPRGTAGVISYGASTSLDILDLEEDEEDEDEDSGSESDNDSFEE